MLFQSGFEAGKMPVMATVGGNLALNVEKRKEFYPQLELGFWGGYFILVTFEEILTVEI